MPPKQFVNWCIHGSYCFKAMQQLTNCDCVKRKAAIEPTILMQSLSQSLFDRRKLSSIKLNNHPSDQQIRLRFDVALSMIVYFLGTPEDLESNYWSYSTI